MKKFELNVVNFDNEDVIATSCDLDKVFIDFGTEENGQHHATIDTAIYPKGTKFIFDGVTYEVKENGHLEGTRDYNGTSMDGVYHLVDIINTNFAKMVVIQQRNSI